MTTAVQTAAPQRTLAVAENCLNQEAEGIVASLQKIFGVEFAIYRGDDGAILYLGDEQPHGDTAFRGELARAVANRTEPAFLGDEEPLLVFALPFPVDRGLTVVAVGNFVTGPLEDSHNVARIAELLGLSQAKTPNWIAQQEPWSGRQLNAVGRTVLDRYAADKKVQRLTVEIEKVSDNLASTYEEISVLYGVTRNLRLSSTDEELGKLALDWLRDVIPANAIAIEYLSSTHSQELSRESQREPLLLSAGECPLNAEELAAIPETLELDVNSGPIVLNRNVTAKSDWPHPGVRELILVPLSQGDNIYGWLGAFNHNEYREFGTVEASLLSSVAAVLGIHSGNIDLYRRQADFLAQMVRALT